MPQEDAQHMYRRSVVVNVSAFKSGDQEFASRHVRNTLLSYFLCVFRKCLLSSLPGHLLEDSPVSVYKWPFHQQRGETAGCCQTTVFARRDPSPVTSMFQFLSLANKHSFPVRCLALFSCLPDYYSRDILVEVPGIPATSWHLVSAEVVDYKPYHLNTDYTFNRLE